MKVQPTTAVVPFDIRTALDLDPKSPDYEQLKLRLTVQLLTYIIGRMVEDHLHLQDKVEDYQQEFIQQVKKKK